LAIEEGAPPLSYWEGLYDQLKKVGCELDFPAIEELVINCLVLRPKAMEQAENGRLLSFVPPSLLCIGTGDIEARVAEELLVVKMHDDLLAHQTGITQALHDLTQQHHTVGNNYAKFYMSPENIKYIDSGACRALFHFCNTLIHKDDNLRTVAQLWHTTQVITKKKGGCSTWHHDGASPKKKTVCDDEGEPTSVTDYNNPSHKQECTQRGAFVRSILVTGETEHQAISSLLIESTAAVVRR
jgi:hypothetical protein